MTALSAVDTIPSFWKSFHTDLGSLYIHLNRVVWNKVHVFWLFLWCASSKVFSNGTVFSMANIVLACLGYSVISSGRVVCSMSDKRSFMFRSTVNSRSPHVSYTCGLYFLFSGFTPSLIKWMLPFLLLLSPLRPPTLSRLFRGFACAVLVSMQPSTRMNDDALFPTQLTCKIFD